MKLWCLVSSALLLLLFSLSSVVAQESAGDATAGDATVQAEEKPDETQAIIEFMNSQLAVVQQLSESDVDAALKKVDEMAAFLGEQAPESEKAKGLLENAQRYLVSLKDRLIVAKTPLEEIVKKLDADPADQEALSQYAKKIMRSAADLARSDLAKAAESIEEAKSYLATLREKLTDNKDAIGEIDQAEQSWSRLAQQIQSQIEREAKLAALIGQDAAPLTADAWVNGEPVSDEDVQGKVVLLDFWAVWCGPCIATFPHLTEWNELYKDQGLVMIGVTGYYNFVWNEEAGQIERVAPDAASDDEQVMHEKEQEMLVKFAEKHELTHVFAVQEGQELAEFYAVAGIPQVVLIDRAGKVRLVKVGSGPENAKEIDEMLKQLLEEK